MNNTPQISEEDIFQKASALPGAERDAYLAAACGDDAALRLRIERLLGSHEATKFMNERPPSAELETERMPQNPESGGGMIGPYKLREQIGEGGFGTVWVADQENPVRRRVALKIIKLGMDTKEVMARFDQERQALAMMDHPNIARVLDAGTTDQGRPYFVMELVRGVKITEYCDDQKLSTKERIDLFITVCQAVQHAHQKGIIHRDLKPSNILVTINDGKAVPKVIDFGVAKATQGRLTEQTIYTQFQQMIGTPLYMSPEQAELTSLDIDTRSDIYALGVLLYELLTGHTPIDQKTMARLGLDEMRRMIREVDPPRPSARMKTLDGAELTTAAKRRHTDAAKLPGVLRGDIDWIVMKCLEKDRKRRYDTANGLALDLQRHLDNEVITARPPTAGYLLIKLIRRNKLAFAAGTAIALSMIFGVAVSTWQAWRATEAEREQRHLRAAAEKAAADAAASEHKAVDEAAKSAKTAQFIQSILTSIDSQAASGANRDLMVDLLTRAGGRASIELKDQPEVNVEVTGTIARCFDKIGFTQAAEEVARDALRIAKATFGMNDLRTAQLMTFVASRAVDNGRLDDAEELASGALEIQRRLSGRESRPTREAMRVLGDVLNGRGNAEGAERVLREYRTVASRSSEEGEDSIAAGVSLARALSAQGRHDEAAMLLREAVAGYERTWGPTRRRTTRAVNLLYDQLIQQGKSAEAEALARRHKKQLNSSVVENADSVLLDLKLARLLEGTEKDAEAGAMLRETFDRTRRVFADAHPLKREVMDELAKWFRGQGQLADADALKGLMDAPPPPLSASEAFRAGIVSLEYKWRADSTDPGTALDLAARLAWLGRMHEWKALSRQIVERVKDTTFGMTAERAAKCALFVPGADSGVTEKAATLAHYALEHNKGSFLLPFFQLCAGMAEYRRGNSGAAENLLAAIDPKAPSKAHSTAQIYRAMIAIRQGRPDDARLLLADAAELMPPLPPDESAPFTDEVNKDDLITWLAWKEAWMMLESKK